MAVVVGITGGIGSGKSTICKIFKLLGVSVFEADSAARELIETDITVKTGLKTLFGNDIYTPGGILNRKKLAGIIFKDKDKRDKVNQIVHPEVRKSYYMWLKAHNNHPYLIYEAAILFEGGFNKEMDFNILVTAPEDQRARRVAIRNGISEQSVRDRMKSQWPDERKKELADLIIVNDNKSLILPVIIRLDKKLRTHGTIW